MLSYVVGRITFCNLLSAIQGSFPWTFLIEWAHRTWQCDHDVIDVVEIDLSQISSVMTSSSIFGSLWLQYNSTIHNCWENLKINSEKTIKYFPQNFDHFYGRCGPSTMHFISFVNTSFGLLLRLLIIASTMPNSKKSRWNFSVFSGVWSPGWELYSRVQYCTTMSDKQL